MSKSMLLISYLQLLLIVPSDFHYTVSELGEKLEIIVCHDSKLY